MPVCPKCGKPTEWRLVAALSPMVKASSPKADGALGSEPPRRRGENG
jgi:hypothetical protein